VHDTSWQHRYAGKLLTAEQAIRRIAPGRRILIGSGAAEPVTLVDALATHGDHLADNDVVHLLTLGAAPYVRPELGNRFRHAAFFIGPNVREAVQAGRADFMPVFLSEIPRLIRSRRVRVDVALLQVSPPDVHGYVSLGVSVDIVRAAVEAAELVLAEVNPLMPRTHGDSFVRVADLDGLIPVETPVLERAPEHPDEVSLAIGRHVASLIPDGATIQTGIGAIPHAVVTALAHHHDLGVHTEMLSDTVLDLVLSGVVNGRKKTLLPGKIVTSFVMGTRRLYDWVNDNPAVELRPSDFTNDPFVIAQNDRMVAINSALAVDLTGQVAADTLGGRFYSGIGGQVDFIRGAARSRDGKPIIALPSTAKGGKVSRIQATLEAGAGVVTSRGDVHWVVTEYGVADLWGKTIRQRAQALIEVAHPDVRPDLVATAKARKYVLPDQGVPRAESPAERPEFVQLDSNTAVCIRTVRMSDEDALQDLFYGLSEESAYQRFLGHRRPPSREELLQLVDTSFDGNTALVATVASDCGDELIALARYDVAPSTGMAEVSLVVSDPWQGRGVGTALFQRLAKVARARGVAGLTADVLPTNGPMLALFSECGYPVESVLDRGVCRVKVVFSHGAPAPGAGLGAPSR
jgi:acyl-CoA hydrolase/GNAT superfamily N-acetyltransferase